MPAPINPNDILKKKFGKLTVESYIGKELRGKSTWEHMYDCSCSCGAAHVKAARSALISGDKSSCGCAHKDAGDAVIEDLTGRRFERWKVIERAPNRISKSGKTRSIMWLCECQCGTRRAVGARALKNGTSTSCGCLQKERVSQANTDDLTDKEFVHLKVMYRNGSWYPKNYGIGKKKGGVRAVWHCSCDCGNECDVVGELLRNGDITSCGCSHTSKFEHHVIKYLESIGYKRDVDYFREKTFPGLVGTGGGALRFDFYVRLKSGEYVLIECQGEQHSKSVKWFGGNAYFERLQKHDAMKREFAVVKNMRLIEIQYENVSYDMISDFLMSEGVL